MRILLIEDEADVARFVKQGLAEAGYAVDLAADGEEGLAFARGTDYDAAVVDIMLPRLNGIEVVTEMRRVGCKTPVIFLTALGSTRDKVNGLDSGGDDYLVKPFSMRELLARVRALVRRPSVPSTTVLRYADLEMDIGRHEVRRGGAVIDLSPREFTLLEALMHHPEQTLTRAQIIRKVWSSDFSGDTNVIDVYVGYLRRKVDRGSRTKLIKTVRGVGYTLEAADD